MTQENDTKEIRTTATGATEVSISRIRYILSMVFVVAYLSLLAAILVIEASDQLNRTSGDNSLMDLLKVLVGVMTAVVLQIMNFWFDNRLGKKTAD